VDGLSNKEIARNLDIIEGTVKAHVRSLMGKLGVRNRTQLAVTATRAGLLDDSV
jgi:two-component system nitrate/nitrite response regulator NarL